MYLGSLHRGLTTSRKLWRPATNRKWSRNGASRLGLFLPHHVEDRFLPPINGPPPVSIADDVRGFRSHRPSGWLFFKFRDSHYIARPPCGSARLDLSPYL
jgi:hypothetical protein